MAKVVNPVWSVAIESSTDLLAPICGVLALIVLVFMSSVLVAGKRRRRHWRVISHEAEAAGGNESGSRMARAKRAERSSDFLDNLMRRLYYAIAVASALGMVTLPMMPIDQGTRLAIWLVLIAITFLSAFILLIYWRDWDNEREVLLRRALRARQERAISRAGLIVRDELTGLYTSDFWLHALEMSSGRLFRKPTPITCLMIGLKGLPELGLQVLS